MKYLVNRETKKHVLCATGTYPDSGVWRIVEADDDGWIKWNDGECPLPKTAKVDLKWKFGGDNFKAQADGWNWEGSGTNRILFYRPVIKSKSKPALEEAWDVIERDAKVDVFTRLSSAVAASDEIPSLIAEINAMLPEGYEVTRSRCIIAESDRRFGPCVETRKRER